MANERIRDLNMSTVDVVIALCGGNPGAMSVCVRMLKEGANIDPDSARGGLGAVLSLDTENIWEERIWMLCNDVCGQDLVKTLALLRALQLGGLAGVTSASLNHAIDNRGEGIDVDAALAAVQERLPKFGLAVQQEAGQ